MKYLSVLIVASVAAIAVFNMYGTQENGLEAAFGSYMTQYGKNYQTEDEYLFRKSIFAANHKKIEEHNAKGLSWTYGVNEYTDWTDEEYQRLLGYKPQFKNTQNDAAVNDWPVNCPTPEEMETINHRDNGFVTPVKNQGACGSCWAFSAVGALEGAYYRKTGELVSFSESQLVECEKFSHGCNGGLMTNAFIHWMRKSPILEEDYPYRLPVETCEEDSIPSAIEELKWGYRVDIGWQCLYEALKHSPVSVAIRAENDDFRHYGGGIIDGEGCGTDLDHGVTLVGYLGDDDAWLVKNSWGADWGENGYVRIRRGEDFGVCGINQENAAATYFDDHVER